ncbi:MAG: winged helix-turn-helix transcriptional regulator [Acidilobaceae archaeon]
MSIIRNFIGGLGPRHRTDADPGVENIDFDEITARLELAKLEVDRARDQLTNEITSYYDKMQTALRTNDTDTAEMIAAEIVLKKKVLTALTAYSKLLGIAIQRVRDARSIEALIKSIAPLDYWLRATNSYLALISPELVSRLSNVMVSAESLIREVGVLANNMPTAKVEIDPEARQEIAYALAELGIRVQTQSQEDIEKSLLEYVRTRGGRISLSVAARDLNMSPEAVKRALESLEAKGLVKIHRITEASAESTV